MKRVIVATMLSLVLLFALGMVAYGETNKVKLTGAELQSLISESNAVTFGLNQKFQTVYMIVGHGNGKRNLYWRSQIKKELWGMNTGTVRIDGDNLCENYPTRLNPESCYEVYRVGEDKYELWLQGSLVRTWFSGQAEYNEPKKKDKLPAPEFGDSFIIAGILHKTKTAWIIWAEGEKRELFWRSLANPGFSGSDTTTVRIDGDKECLKWTWGPESCTEAYRTGENSFESWANGDIDSTYFRLK